MPTYPIQPIRRVLAADERISEVLFGLIMVLTFTGSLSVAEAGRDDVRTMLIGALGCNLAWGIIDAALYLMGCLAESGRGLKAFRAVRSTTNPEAAQRIIAGALPQIVASILEPAEFRAIHQRLLQLPEPKETARPRRDDLIGAVGVFLLVVVATFPTAIPFVVMQDAALALRISNGIAIGMMFGLGYTLGLGVGHRAWLHGIGMVVLGAALVALTIALGG